MAKIDERSNASADDKQLPLEKCLAAIRRDTQNLITIVFYSLNSTDFYILQVESEIVLRSTNDRKTRVPTNADAEALSALLTVTASPIEQGIAMADGRIMVTFESGDKLNIDSQLDFEAWNLSGPHGMRIVSMPGRQLAVWDA